MTSVEALLEDLRRFEPTITRDEYVAKGNFSKRAYLEHFANFGDFRNAAFGITYTTAPPKQESAQETNEFHDDKWEISLPKTRIHTLDELVEHCKIDLTIWNVDRCTIKKWDMGAKVGPKENKQLQVEELFAVSAVLSKRKSIVDAKEEIEKLKKEAEVVARIPIPIVRTNRNSGNMLEISLNDAHFGKLAWSRETGGPNYDTKIAQTIFLEAFEHLLDRAKGYTFDSVLFVVGNDLLHSDDLQGRTTKGTIVSCDIRYYKTFEVVRETITKCIERLRQLAPVVVKMVQGNHDELSVWHLGDSLSCLFKNYDDVAIDNEPQYRKYHQWGLNGLLLTHGDKGKRSDYPLLFATERPDIFGSTKFREVHTGHYHQTKTEEFHGVRVRIIPSLSAADSWHAANAFVGQQRIGEAYIFNKTEGLIAQFYHNADA